MALKYTFRMAEIPQVGAVGTDEKQAALDGMVEDMTRQGWEVAEWQLTPDGHTSCPCVYVAVLFSRRDPPEPQAHYISADYLERRVQEWRDAQRQRLNEEPKTGTIARSRLEGAVEAFEQVLHDIRESAQV